MRLQLGCVIISTRNYCLGAKVYKIKTDAIM